MAKHVVETKAVRKAKRIADKPIVGSVAGRELEHDAPFYAKRVVKQATTALKNDDLTERVYRSTHGKTDAAPSWGGRWTDSELARVERMRGQGKSMAMIAIELGRSIVSLESRKWDTPLKRTTADTDAAQQKRASIGKTMAKAIVKASK